MLDREGELVEIAIPARHERSAVGVTRDLRHGHPIGRGDEAGLTDLLARWGRIVFWFGISVSLLCRFGAGGGEGGLL